MKDPIEAVKRELRSMGAECVAGGKGSSKWKLPDRREFLFERKSGNPRRDAQIAMRKLHAMISPPSPREGAANPPVTAPPPVPPPLAPVEIPIVDVVASAPGRIPPGSARSRWAEGLAQLESYEARIRAELGRVEKRIEMYRKFEPYVDNPEFLGDVRAMLPEAAQKTPAKPQSEYVRVQVTRELVRDAIKCFDTGRDFTLTEVVDLLTHGYSVDAPEFGRVRASVQSAVYALMREGEVARTIEGVGKKPAYFQRVGQSHKQGHESLELVGEPEPMNV